MSVTVSKQFNTYKQVPALGITFPAVLETLSVTYAVIGIIDITGDQVTVAYSTQVENITQKGDFMFTFTYSGSGVIMDEAESALRELVDPQ